MKLLTFVTPSHSELYEDWFLASLDSIGFNRSDLVTCFGEQNGSGTFKQPGFCETVTRKAWAIHTQLGKMVDGDILVFSDCDVQFFGPFMAEIEENLESVDVTGQADKRGHQVCAGFVAMSVNESTTALWELAALDTHKYPDKEQDQTALNSHLKNMSHNVLSDRYWTVGKIKLAYWDGYDFDIPDDIIMHHANFAVGMDRKLELMDKVYQKVNK